MIYLDNAATSWPKPEQVYVTMDRFLRNAGANPGRGGSQMASEAERTITETRELLTAFFNGPDPSHTIFTLNATDALNMGIKGLLRPGDHVITSHLEHNSVTRPLFHLEQLGVELSFVKNDADGVIDLQDLEAKIKPNTKLIVISHASNVIGTLQPLAAIGAIAHKHGVHFMVDAAQSAGVYKIDMAAMQIDLLAFPGHKSLFGPPGTGVLILGEGITLTPWREGGTGLQSEELAQPTALPIYLESGTMNTVGIAGLGAGLKFILAEGMERIRAYEEMLVDRLLQGLLAIPGVQVFGPLDARRRAAVVSFRIEGWKPGVVDAILEQTFRIAGRTGLHCAPVTHQMLGTAETGGLTRFSPGYFNTVAEIDQALAAVRQIAAQKKIN